MLNFEREITVNHSMSGKRVVYESGGGYSNTGSSTIVCGAHGEPLCGCKVGQVACKKHAVLFVQSGDYIINTKQRRGVYEIQVSKIGNKILEEFDGFDETIEVAECFEFRNGEWTKYDKEMNRFYPCELPVFLYDAVDAAKKKAVDYHCRKIYYVVMKNEKSCEEKDTF